MSASRKYRLLMHGRNLLIEIDGKPRKCEFYQNLFIESPSPQQAERLSITRLLHDRRIRDRLINTPSDPPRISMDTYWELDDYDYMGKHLATDLTICEEKRWWQFWK